MASAPNKLSWFLPWFQCQLIQILINCKAWSWGPDKHPMALGFVMFGFREIQICNVKDELDKYLLTFLCRFGQKTKKKQMDWLFGVLVTRTITMWKRCPSMVGTGKDQPHAAMQKGLKQSISIIYTLHHFDLTIKTRKRSIHYAREFSHFLLTASAPLQNLGKSKTLAKRCPNVTQSKD